MGKKEPNGLGVLGWGKFQDAREVMGRDTERGG